MILPLDDGVEVFLQQVDDFLTAGIVLGQGIEQFDEGHRVPTLGTAPAMLCLSGFLICPEHLFRLVPGVTVQTRLGVEGALIGDADLVDGIVVDLLGILGLEQVAGGHRVEGQSHEDTVEPYLIAVDGLVPEYFVLNGTWLVL